MKRPDVRRQTSRRIRALLACGILLGTGAVGTSALWSTTAATESGTFTTATIEILANQTKNATITFDAAPPLLPGYTTAAMIDVKNSGSLNFTYVPSVQGSAGATSVAQYTTLKSVQVGQAAGVVPSTGRGSTCPAGAAVGSSLNVSTQKVAFAPARSLNVGNSERLCMQLTVRMDAPDSAAGRAGGTAGSVTFTFDATG